MLTPLYESLLSSLPEVPSDPAKSLTEGNGDTKVGENVSVQIFSIECLLYTLLHLVKSCPKFLGMVEPVEGDTAIQEGNDRLKALRQKVQYLARLIQSYKSDIVAKLAASFQEEGRPADAVLTEIKKVNFWRSLFVQSSTRH